MADRMSPRRMSIGGPTSPGHGIPPRRLSRGNVGAGSPSFGGMRTSIGGGSPNVKKGFSFSQSFYDDRYPGEEQNETETVSSTTSQSTGSYKGIQGIDDVEKHPSRGSNASTTFPKSPRASVGEYYADKVADALKSGDPTERQRHENRDKGIDHNLNDASRGQQSAPNSPLSEASKTVDSLSIPPVPDTILPLMKEHGHKLTDKDIERYNRVGQNLPGHTRSSPNSAKSGGLHRLPSQLSPGSAKNAGLNSLTPRSRAPHTLPSPQSPAIASYIKQQTKSSAEESDATLWPTSDPGSPAMSPRMRESLNSNSSNTFRAPALRPIPHGDPGSPTVNTGFSSPGPAVTPSGRVIHSTITNSKQPSREPAGICAKESFYTKCTTTVCPCCCKNKKKSKKVTAAMNQEKYKSSSSGYLTAADERDPLIAAQAEHSYVDIRV